MVDRLVPSNMLLTVVSRTFEGATDKKETWYQTDYKVEPLDPTSMAGWANPTDIDPELKLPSPNSLIATDFALRGLPEGLEVGAEAKVCRQSNVSAFVEIDTKAQK